MNMFLFLFILFKPNDVTLIARLCGRPQRNPTLGAWWQMALTTHWLDSQYVPS